MHVLRLLVEIDLPSFAWTSQLERQADTANSLSASSAVDIESLPPGLGASYWLSGSQSIIVTTLRTKANTHEYFPCLCNASGRCGAHLGFYRQSLHHRHIYLSTIHFSNFPSSPLSSLSPYASSTPSDAPPNSSSPSSSPFPTSSRNSSSLPSPYSSYSSPVPLSSPFSAQPWIYARSCPSCVRRGALLFPLW